MRPREKGWLKEYLEFRKELFKDLTHEKPASHPEQSLYRIMHPTGLMYGQSVGKIDHPLAENWDEKDRMKILLAESLISSSLVYHNKPLNSHEEISEVFVQSLESIGSFYNNIYPELATPTRTIFGKKRSAVDLAERILEKRVNRAVSFKGNFWSSFFHNSLLFLDVYIFGQWIHTNADRIVADFFRYEREELRFSVIKVIAVAAHSDQVLNYEEKRMLEYFLQGTELPPEKRREALMIFNKGVSVDEINLPAENSWILKKYFLEIAILTTWADRKVKKAEQVFLRYFADYLGFTEDDLEYSMIAIEGFVLEHWTHLEYLQDKQDYERVSEHYMERVSKLAERNKSRLIREVQESSALVALLEKARAQELTLAESEKVQEQLLNALRTIPTFAIVTLPQRFLTLSILMKILPRDIFFFDKDTYFDKQS
ncbi:MAG: TerB family tellurite resistance protein [Cyclobacteriaceae bacterium]|nr:TerB family tellurite resistance protein [Cyclobacteriaceae bacterium]